MRQVGSSAQGVQHSAAVHSPGTWHEVMASTVETIAPALPVSGQLKPRHWSQHSTVVHGSAAHTTLLGVVMRLELGQLKESGVPSAFVSAHVLGIPGSVHRRGVPWSSPPHGLQHSAAMQASGSKHGASAVEIIAPALPVSGQLKPRHGYVG